MPYPNITEITVFHPTLLLVLFLDESALLRFRWNLNFRLQLSTGSLSTTSLGMWACSVSIQSRDTKSNLELTARRPASRENLLELNRLLRVMLDSKLRLTPMRFIELLVTSCVES